MRIAQYRILYAIEMCSLISCLVLTQYILTMKPVGGDLCCITDLCYMAYAHSSSSDLTLNQDTSTDMFSVDKYIRIVCLNGVD